MKTSYYQYYDIEHVGLIKNKNNFCHNRKMRKEFALVFCVIFSLAIIKIMHNLPHFMSKEEFRAWLEADPDFWAASHNDINLSVKNSRTPEEFLQLCMNYATDFSWRQKLKLIAACKKAENFFRTFGRSKYNIGFEGIDFNTLANMKWEFACYKDREIEAGCPFTRMNVIHFCQPDLNDMSLQDLTRTVIHERCHTYERLYPGDLEIWMKAKGFVRWKRSSEEPLYKNNPDNPPWIYKDFEGREMYMKFTSEKPKNFWAIHYPVDGVSASESPYETLAYLLDYLYYRLNFYNQPTFLNKDHTYIDKFYDMSIFSSDTK